MKGIDNMKNDKFYEKEQPKLVTAKGSELRLYREGQVRGIVDE